MNRLDARVACIKAQGVAVVRSRGLYWNDLHPVTQKLIIDEQTAAFDALHGLAVVAAIDSAFKMTSYIGNEYEVVSILSDLTNAPEKKTCIERVDFECDLDSIINVAIHNEVALDDIKHVLQRTIDNFDPNWGAVTNPPEKKP